MLPPGTYPPRGGQGFQPHVPLRHPTLQISHKRKGIRFHRGTGSSALGREQFLSRSKLSGGCGRGGQSGENGQKQHPRVHPRCHGRSVPCAGHGHCPVQRTCPPCISNTNAVQASRKHEWDECPPPAPKFVTGGTEARCSAGCEVRAAGRESCLYGATDKKGDMAVLQTLMVHQAVVGWFPFNSHLPESAACTSFHSALRKTKQVSNPRWSQMKLKP